MNKKKSVYLRIFMNLKLKTELVLKKKSMHFWTTLEVLPHDVKAVSYPGLSSCQLFRPGSILSGELF